MNGQAPVRGGCRRAPSVGQDGRHLRRVKRRPLDEAASLVDRRKERVDLRSQFGVLAATVKDERRAFRRRAGKCRLDGFLDAPPGGGVHQRRSLFRPVAILRNNQPFATTHSRVTVERDTASTLAISPSERPPK